MRGSFLGHLGLMGLMLLATGSCKKSTENIKKSSENLKESSKEIRNGLEKLGEGIAQADVIGVRKVFEAYEKALAEKRTVQQSLSLAWDELRLAQAEERFGTEYWYKATVYGDVGQNFDISLCFSGDADSGSSECLLMQESGRYGAVAITKATLALHPNRLLVARVTWTGPAEAGLPQTGPAAFGLIVSDKEHQTVRTRSLVFGEVGEERTWRIELHQDFPRRGSAQNPARSCLELRGVSADDRANGRAWIQPAGAEKSFQSFCEQELDGGGWSLVARIPAGNTAFDYCRPQPDAHALLGNDATLTAAALTDSQINAVLGQQGSQQEVLYWVPSADAWVRMKLPEQRFNRARVQRQPEFVCGTRRGVGKASRTTDGKEAVGCGPLGPGSAGKYKDKFYVGSQGAHANEGFCWGRFDNRDHYSVEVYVR